MKVSGKKNVAGLLVLFTLLFAFGLSSVHAQNTTTGNMSAADSDPGVTDEQHPCQGADSQPCVAPNPSFDLNIKLENPLSVSTIPEAIALFMRVVFKIAVPVIVFFFLWTGLSYILALGKPDKLKKVHNMFLWTVVGTLLVLGAYTITNILVGTVNTVINL
jgi:hypothetical protein